VLTVLIRRLFRTLVVLLACLGALLVLVTVAPPRWYIQWLGSGWNHARGSVLIVLGGDSLETGMIGETSYWRSVFAVMAWRTGGFQHVILSGAASTIPMRDFLVSQGVPPDAIVVEGRSVSTRENAIFSVPLARQWPGPYVLLTSDFHMWRAERAFRKAGLDVIGAPLSEAMKRANDWRSRWRVFIDLAQETVKIVYYRSRGWI